MNEISLEFIARQLERVLNENRGLRTELGLLRDEMHLIRSTVGRIDDVIHMDVIDRLRRLEETRA